MRVRRPILLSASALAASTLVLAGCGVATGSSAEGLKVAPAAAPLAAAVADTTCKDGKNQVASLDPKIDNITTDWHSVKNSKTMENIQKHGYLTVGTSGDVLLWGATNPKTGFLEGYDVDLLKEIAHAAGVDPAKTVYKVINYGERLTALKSGAVDVVAHTMTINCARWEGIDPAPNAINFSTEYYRAGQKVLIRSDDVDTITSINDLKDKPVCVPSASTNLALIQKLGFQNIVALDVVGDCLVKFQEGEVSAITGDDTVLAGFAKQDPYAVLLKGRALSEEPYGVGINGDDPKFTEFVNAVLADLRSNGKLTDFYKSTMGAALPDNPIPTPPPAVYGRDIDKLQRAS